MSAVSEYADLLKLIEISGPFVSLPVFKEVFPQSFLRNDSRLTAALREAYDEWRVARQSMMHTVSPKQREWLGTVFTQALEWPADYIAEHNAIPQHLALMVPQHQETLRPDLALWDGSNPQLLVRLLTPAEGAHRRPPESTWNASHVSRMAELLVATQVPMGLITNGERWTLVYAERQQPTGTAEWRSELWFDERLTLRAFRDLLGIRSFFGRPPDQTLSALYRRSIENQQEVSITLGRQVRSAVELFVAALDRADREHHRELLRAVNEETIYEAALSIMMRLVFLLFAEEQNLLPVSNPIYHEHYAVSTIHAQLRQAADDHGEEVLEHRYDAFPRLLATFRAVHGGVEHDLFTLPAYGGHLFDPDRYPFLERRPGETTWRDTQAQPYPVNNRTVLHLLEALQFLKMKVPGGGIEKRQISFRALDIEQIGHVYEGLLDHTAKRASEPILGLAGSEDPEIPLSELEAHSQQPDFLPWLKDETGRSVSALQNALNELPPADPGRWPLWDRVRPFAGLVRRDDNGDPYVIQAGSVYVTAGAARRQTGTQYTPRSLTREVVRYALEPVCYIGPAEGKPAEEWQLKSAAELLNLKICDPACGSGAFLAEACRYLADPLVEAWATAEKRHGADVQITPYGDPSSGLPGEMLLPKDEKERLIIARRLIAQRCLYGVDRNPLAVEMAKLSLWLLTLEKDKPFTFLDHSIRCGDSLLGLNAEQLKHYNLSGTEPQARVLWVNDDLAWASEQREGLAKLQYRPEDQERMLKGALARTRRARAAADLLLATAFDGNGIDLSHQVSMGLEQQEEAATASLAGKRPFHWSVEFPEVFVHADGFDSIVGNPPFMGGQKITGALGTEYREYLVRYLARGRRGSADLSAYFFLRSADLLTSRGTFGLLATNTIAQGDTREVGLEQVIRSCTLFRAIASRKWPGDANLHIAYVWGTRGLWYGTFIIDELRVGGITPLLTPPTRTAGKPFKLATNVGRAIKGSEVGGIDAFVLSSEKARELLAVDAGAKDVLKPFLDGEDLLGSPTQTPQRTAIYFGDWPLERARSYPAPLKYVEIRSEGDSRKKWWQFRRPTPSLYEAIQPNSKVLVTAADTDTFGPVFVRPDQVFSKRLIVFTEESWGFFSVVQSSLHYGWVDRYGSTLETRMSYIISDCFETYPFPSNMEALNAIGESYHRTRAGVMLARGKGLTALYNSVDDPSDESDDIWGLRSVHAELDRAVAAAYGWNDLELGHGFHPTRQGIRYTISEPARREVLDRLLALNHERHAAEIAAAPEPKAKRSSRKKTAPQPALF